MLALLSFVALALANEGHEAPAEGIPWTNLVIVGANLGIFVAFLAWFARRPVADALHGRSNHVRAALDEAQKLHDEAQARYAEVDAKLQSLDARLDEMKREAEASANAEAARIAERAEADAARIRETAERTIREEAVRARNTIRREAVEAASSLAREHLRRSVRPEDQTRLAVELLGAVKGDA